MKLNSVAESSGVSLVGGTQMQVSDTGVYNLQFSAQIHDTGGGGGGKEIVIWLKKNGSDVPETSTKLSLSSSSPYTVAAWNFVLTMNAGEFVELYWQTNNTNIVIEKVAATGAYPDIPSLIATLTQVMYTQVGPTGPSGATGAAGPTGTGVANTVSTTGVQITATTTNPVPGARTSDQINYITIADTRKITMKLGWTAGTAGSGEYLFNLPSGVTFNTAADKNPSYTGTLWTPNVSSMSPYLIPVSGGVIQSGSWSSVMYAMPYDTNRFSLLADNNVTNSLGRLSSTWYPFSTDGLLNIAFDIWT
jgi:hypothetical protein